MSREDDLKKLQKDIEASAPKPENIAERMEEMRRSETVSERHSDVQPAVRDNRVLEMFSEILNRLNTIEGKIDELRKDSGASAFPIDSARE